MTQLTLEERYGISTRRELGLSNREIGENLGRHRSTIWRELKRNADGRSGRYGADLAERKTRARHVDKNKHRAFTPQIKTYVTELLEKDLSPEQINGLARRHGTPCVSVERIYQFVWKDKKDGGKLYRHLRTRGRKYRKRGAGKAGRGHIPNRTDIGQRPAVVDTKTRVGDLEMDLIIGKGQRGALLTINDRATGILRMGHVKGKEAKDIENRAIELLGDWAPLMHTMTTDNGKEFANHERIAEQLGIDFYFATPYHSWERGANENLNGLVRQYFPKGSNFENIDEKAVESAERILNNRPRKRYGYLSPNEVFAKAIDNNGIVAFMT